MITALLIGADMLTFSNFKLIYFVLAPLKRRKTPHFQKIYMCCIFHAIVCKT